MLVCSVPTRCTQIHLNEFCMLDAGRSCCCKAVQRSVDSEVLSLAKVCRNDETCLGGQQALKREA